MSSTATTTPLTTDRYPIFEANQVLTSFHLNQLRSYLDEQDRLSRIKLLGTGIFCGLEVERTGVTLALSGGAGVSTEGYLLETEGKILTKYAAYTDSTGYSPFRFDDGAGPEQVDMWELLEEDTTNENAENLTSPFLTNKAVILYLEIKDRDIKSCLGEDCTDKGKDRLFNLKVLLVGVSDAIRIIKQGHSIPVGTSLPEHFLKRFEPKPLTARSSMFVRRNSNLHEVEARINEINDGDKLVEVYERALNDDFIESVYEAMNESYELYEPILAPQYNHLNPFQGMSARLNDIRDNHDGSGNGVMLQYVFGFVKDLVKAYNEFIQVAFELVAECCPSSFEYPQHLFLGLVNPGNDCKPSVYRTHFTPSPLYNGQSKKLKKALQYHQRMVDMFNLFDIDHAYNDPDIRITPSKEKSEPLEERAIPFYYPSNQLLETWNFPLTQRCQQEYIQGYFPSEDSDVPFVEEPLKFDLDQFDFLRIEGLIGKDLETVTSWLELTFNKYNLPVDLVTANIRENNPQGEQTGEEDNCVPQELQNDYSLVRAEMICLIQNFMRLEPGRFSQLLAQVAPYFSFNYGVTGNPFEDAIERLTKCLEHFDLDSFTEAYKLIYALFKFMDLFTFRLGGDNGALDVVKGDTKDPRKAAEYAHLLDIHDRLVKFFNNCTYPKLVAAYYHNQWRKEQVQNKKRFSTLVLENPGLRHMAGVPMGGTFLLAYQEDPAAGVNRVIADFALDHKICDDKECLPCINNRAYPPSAPPMFVYVTSGREVQIDVIRNARDINVESVYIATHDVVSQIGATISRRPGNLGDVLVYMPIDSNHTADTFTYVIENESGLHDMGTVYLVINFSAEENNRTNESAKHFDRVAEHLRKHDHIVHLDEEDPITNKYGAAAEAYSDLAETLENYQIDPDGEKENLENKVKEVERVMTDTHKAIIDKVKELGDRGVDVTTPAGKLQAKLEGKGKEVAELEHLETLYNDQLETVLATASEDLLGDAAADSVNSYVDTQVRAQLKELEKYGLEEGARQAVDHARNATTNKDFKKRIKNI